MNSSWQKKDGHIACRWSGAMEREKKYDSSWMQTSPASRGSYLPELPDFANHSPFGGPYSFWFLPEQCRHPQE